MAAQSATPLRRWCSFLALAAAPLLAACAQGVADDLASNDPTAGSVSPLASACTPGATSTCTTTGEEACSAGIRYCSSNSEWGACIPTGASPEQCGDGVDNDCNGLVDDCYSTNGGGSGGADGAGGSGGSGGGGPCTPGQIVSCPTKCGTTGAADCRTDGTPGECIPPEELCGNLVDDNCDGVVDEDCGETHDCRDYAPHNCNSDLGYGDHCNPEDNLKGCDWEWFQAWCHRRDEANNGPANWDNAVKGWVEDRCDGTVTFSGNTYQCTDSSGHTWVCDTPLVLVFGSTEPRLQPAAGSFDLSGSGQSPSSDWPTADTPWLALDRNGNGRIDDGRELFGSATPLARGGTADHGFLALAELDLDRDGQVSVADPGFARLVLWADANRDRVSQPDELVPLAARGVTRIALDYRVDARCDARGNCGIERAWFEIADGETCRLGAVVDLHLARR